MGRAVYVFGPLQLGDEFEEGEISFILFLATEDLVPDPAPFDHSRAAAFEERLVGTLELRGALSHDFSGPPDRALRRHGRHASRG
jgi:hypothetical protein